MENLYTHINGGGAACRRLQCGQSLFTIYNCLVKGKYHALWSHYNYIIYVVEGRKTWHTPHGSYPLRPGSCVFVRKGAALVEQFFDADVCLALFFLPDDFISEVLKE